MSDKLVSQLTELTSVDAANDKIPILDASDPTEIKYVIPNNIAPTIPSATTTVEGKVELATDAETIAGTDTARAVTPSNITGKIDTDGTFAGNSDTRIPSQKAVKTYVDSHTGSGTDWTTYSTVVPTLSSATKDKYTLSFAGVDLTSFLNVGKRVKLVQTVGSSTKSLDLELSSSQYATKTDTASLSITGTICIEAWVNIESIGTDMAIASKFYQDGTVKAYLFYIKSNGFLSTIWSSDSNNESEATATSGAFTAADIGRWVHIAISLTPSTKTATMYKDGVSLSVAAGTGTQTSIADNTATFAIGARDVQGTPDTFFDGLIAEVRLWNTTRTQQQVRDNMFHNLVGNESGLAGYWKFDNNYNDTTANANNLTSSGSPVFSSSLPAKLSNGTKYGIISSISFSTNTTLELMMGSDYGVDGGTISGFAYSLLENPIGFPVWMNYFPDGPTGTSIISRFTTCGRTVKCVMRGVATGAMTWTNMPTLPLVCSASAASLASDASGDGVGSYADFGTANSPAGLTPSVAPSGTTVRVVGTVSTTVASATNPITWAANDTWYLNFKYEF